MAGRLRHKKMGAGGGRIDKDAPEPPLTKVYD